MRDDHLAYIHFSQGAHQQSAIQRHLRLLQLGAPLVATMSGILHAYGMALRKRHGTGTEGKTYWKEPGWWFGLLMDLLGGLCFTLAAPLMAVELLVPLTAVAQLSTAFVCGCCVFQERSTMMQQMGFVLSVCAVILLGNATTQSHVAVGAVGPHSSARFWKLWIKPHVLAVHGFWLCSTCGAFVSISSATGFAVLSAYFDGMQFLFTRTFAMILETANKLNTSLMVQLCVGKALSAILAIHWQQEALGEDLTSIGSVLPLLQNLTQASLGATFFGDQLLLSPSVVGAALLAPLGVWLLAQTPDARRRSSLALEAVRRGSTGPTTAMLTPEVK